MAFDPVSLISGVGSLLGGLFNRPPSAEKQSYQGIMGQARGARDASEQYGFNPLTLLGVSSPLGAGSGPGMGAAISDAMALLADGYSRRSDLGQKEALQRENTDLRERLTKQTLQPQVPGVYDRIEQGPMIGASNAARAGVSQAVSGTRPARRPAGVGGGVGEQLRPLPETVAVDPRRPADHEPSRTHPGFFTVDNPYLPYPVYVPTLDGDEALSWYDYPSAIGPIIGSGALWAGQRLLAEDREDRQRQPPTPPRQRRAFGFTPNAFFLH